MNAKVSIIASIVSAAITSVSFQAIANTKTMNVINTNNGMKNHVDATLKRTTFQWADKKIKKANLGPVATSDKVAAASNDYLNQLTGISPIKNSISNTILTKTHHGKHGAKLTKYKQKFADIEVFNREYNILMDKDYNLISASGYLSNNTSTKLKNSLLKNPEAVFGTPDSAIISAFLDVGGNAQSVSVSIKSTTAKYDHFQVDTNNDSGLQLLGTPRAKRILFENEGELLAAHYVEIEVSKINATNSQYYGYVIAAQNGKVLFKNSLTSHAADFSYRIYADANGKPWDSPHGNVIPALPGTAEDSYKTASYLTASLVTLAHSSISTMDPWLPESATTTAGNNVIAYADIVPPQGFTSGDVIATTTGSFTFDYQYDDTQAETSDNNRKAAIVSLFAINNYLHDDFYDHGFDEASGNAQTSNYGRGGEENDALRVEVQDFSGTNNANMSTPADGGSPRMQMFLWDNDNGTNQNGIDYGITVTSDSSIGLLSSTTLSSFGPSNFTTLSGDLVRFEDATSPINDACSSAINTTNLAGNIAIIDRGQCDFTEKVTLAQEAGAIAAIIVNNEGGDQTVVLGSGENDVSAITIPNVSISQNEGQTLYTAMLSNTVTLSMFNAFVHEYKGSSFDNGIVAHEWGHYISNRLIGDGAGLNNNQGRSLGEGWADFHALLLLSEEDDVLQTGNDKYQAGYSNSSYVGSFVNGIRNYPYSTDMAVNPLTFKDIAVSSEIHDSGEVWAVMLWDAYVGLINDNRHTFNEAQSLMKSYLVASYKMTPISPTFTEARDALLSVVSANDDDDYNIILTAFARRGMGIGAISPDRNSTTHEGVVESFSAQPLDFFVDSYIFNADHSSESSSTCSIDGILDVGETASLTFNITNDSDQVLNNVIGQLNVTSGHNVTIENNGVIDFGTLAALGTNTSSPIEITLNQADIADELTLSLSFTDNFVAPEFNFSTFVNFSFEPNSLVNGNDFTPLDDQTALHDFTENVISSSQDAQGTITQQKWANLDGDYYLRINNNTFSSDVAFETRSFEVSAINDFSISWYHLFNFEEHFDGGVVEVSVNNADWVDVLSITGAAFSGNGYNNTINSNTGTSIAGQTVFTGASSTSGEIETINFGSALRGDTVKFRFRVSTDESVGENLGWIIDDINVNGLSSSVFSRQVTGECVLPTVVETPVETVPLESITEESSSGGHIGAWLLLLIPSIFLRRYRQLNTAE